MNNKYSANQIADWFITNIENVSNKKLQKLVYYAYAWYITLFNETVDELTNVLFRNNCEAWQHGPVVPELYHRFKQNYCFDISKEGVIDPSADFDEDVLDLLNQIKDVYGSYNGNELENISHQETPWQLAYEQYSGCIIDNKEIFKCYSQRL